MVCLLGGQKVSVKESESGALLQNEHSDTLDHSIRGKRLPVPLSEDTYKPTHQKAVWDHEWSHKSLRPIIFFRKGHRLFPVSILSYTMALNGLSGQLPALPCPGQDLDLFLCWQFCFAVEAREGSSDFFAVSSMPWTFSDTDAIEKKTF